MKSYYITCIVYYTDYGNDGIPCHGNEVYSLIIREKSEKKAKNKAEIEALEIFNDELNDGNLSNIIVVIDDIYETSDDARK